MLSTFQQAKAANEAIGHHWFDPDTMEHFGTVLGELLPTPGGAVFTHTSTAAPGGPAYKVAYIADDGWVNPSTLDGWHRLCMGDWGTEQRARTVAHALALVMREGLLEREPLLAREARV